MIRVRRVIRSVPEMADGSADTLEKIHAAFRNVVTFNDQDRILHTDMVAAEQFLEQSYNAYL